MNYKELVEMIADAFSKEDVKNVYDALDDALEAGNIEWREHDTLQRIANKVERTAW